MTERQATYCHDFVFQATVYEDLNLVGGRIREFCCVGYVGNEEVALGNAAVSVRPASDVVLHVLVLDVDHAVLRQAGINPSLVFLE